ncbi:hypothetical protein LINPERHAP1_LOCUS14293 [Linum perenne]
MTNRRAGKKVASSSRPTPRAKLRPTRAKSTAKALPPPPTSPSPPPPPVVQPREQAGISIDEPSFPPRSEFPDAHRHLTEMDDEHWARYCKIKELRVQPPVCIDFESLRTRPGWAEKVAERLEQGNLLAVSQLQEDALLLPLQEFWSSFELNKRRKATRVTTCITFRLGGRKHEETYDSFAKALGFTDMQLRDKMLGFDEDEDQRMKRNLELWTQLTGETTFHTSTSKAGSITDPVYRFIFNVWRQSFAYKPTGAYEGGMLMNFNLGFLLFSRALSLWLPSILTLVQTHVSPLRLILAHPRSVVLSQKLGPPPQLLHPFHRLLHLTLSITLPLSLSCSSGRLHLVREAILGSSSRPLGRIHFVRVVTHGSCSRLLLCRSSWIYLGVFTGFSPDTGHHHHLTVDNEVVYVVLLSGHFHFQVFRITFLPFWSSADTVLFKVWGG